MPVTRCKTTQKPDNAYRCVVRLVRLDPLGLKSPVNSDEGNRIFMLFISIRVRAALTAGHENAMILCVHLFPVVQYRWKAGWHREGSNLDFRRWRRRFRRWRSFRRQRSFGRWRYFFIYSFVTILRCVTHMLLPYMLKRTDHAFSIEQTVNSSNNINNDTIVSRRIEWARRKWKSRKKKRLGKPTY